MDNKLYNNDINFNYEDIFRLIPVNMAIVRFIPEIITERENYIYLNLTNSLAALLKTHFEEAVNRPFYSVHNNADDFWLDIFTQTLKTGKKREYSAFSSAIGKFFKISVQVLECNILIFNVLDVTKLKKAEFKASDRRLKIKSMFKADLLVLEPLLTGVLWR